MNSSIFFLIFQYLLHNLNQRFTIKCFNGSSDRWSNLSNFPTSLKGLNTLVLFILFLCYFSCTYCNLWISIYDAIVELRQYVQLMGNHFPFLLWAVWMIKNHSFSISAGCRGLSAIQQIERIQLTLVWICYKFQSGQSYANSIKLEMQLSNVES